MFAIIKTGGKQYKVTEGDEIIVEKLVADEGSRVVFDSVLMIGDKNETTLGAPLVSGAVVRGKIELQRKGAKVMIFKSRQRSTYRRKRGHRQPETIVRIDSIQLDGKPPKPASQHKQAGNEETAPSAQAKKARVSPGESKG